MTTGHTGNRVTNNFGYDEFLRLCEELKMERVPVEFSIVSPGESLIDGDVGAPVAQTSAMAGTGNGD